MTQFFIGAVEIGERTASDFSEFVAIAKGRSIVSAADWGNGRFEIGLSGGAMLRVFSTLQSDLEVNLVQTLNADELPPFLISLGDMQQRVPLATIEQKLGGLRTLYAIFYLFHTDRLQELFEFLEKNPEGDIEQSLLIEGETLYIESISYGSWLLAVWAKTKSSYKAIASVAGVAFDRGREAFLGKLEADARLAQAKALREEIAAAKDEFDLRTSQIDYMLKISSKATSPEIRKNLEIRMISAIRNLTASDPGDSHSYLALESKTSVRPKP